MLPRKIFENSHAVMVILVLLEYFSPKFCLNFLPLFLSASPNMMLLFAHFRLGLCVLGVRFIAIKEVRNNGKIVYIKSVFENGWWEDAYSSTYLLGSAAGLKLRKPSRVWHISVTWHH